MENKISYLNRTYDEIRESLVNVTKQYYSDVFQNLNDASIGSWLIDLLSDSYDALSYQIDRSYQETSIDAAQMSSSVRQLAKNLGVRIPGPKCAIVEVEISCNLPVNTETSSNTNDILMRADERYAPIINKGSLFSTGNETFELIEDVDFSKQFNSEGLSNRTIYPIRNSNGNITGYKYKKLSIARAGRSKVYKTIINSQMIEPFMKITITDDNIVGVNSIILKQGTLINNDPYLREYYVDKESYLDMSGKPVLRFFETENLIDQYRFGYEEEVTQGEDGAVMYNPIWETSESLIDSDNNEIELRKVMKGEWKRLKNKFVTEFTEDGSLEITFGAGLRNEYGEIPSNASDFTQYMMSRMEANDYMGVLPEPNTTMYILYTVGGGNNSNIAENTLTNIVYLDYSISGDCTMNNDSSIKSSVYNSIKVTNPTISYGGKDAPTTDEIRNLTKYISAAQNRCVTLKDYVAKINEIPPRYGMPYRFNVIEENNKIVIYTLGLDYLGHLQSALSETVAENIKNYLSEYKMVTDFISIRSAKIYNISMDIDVVINSAYDKSNVVLNIINQATDFFDIRKHFIGEDYYIGTLEKEIMALDGVENLIRIRIYNKVESGYSQNETILPLKGEDSCSTEDSFNSYTPNGTNEINLSMTDKCLYGNSNSMFEVKYPSTDIKVNIKTITK